MTDGITNLNISTQMLYRGRKYLLVSNNNVFKIIQILNWELKGYKKKCTCYSFESHLHKRECEMSQIYSKLNK